MTSLKKHSAALVYAGLAVGAVITLAPFGLGLLTSFTSAHQFATGTPLTWPRPPTLSNYAGLAGHGFARALAVTALMTAKGNPNHSTVLKPNALKMASAIGVQMM